MLVTSILIYINLGSEVPAVLGWFMAGTDWCQQASAAIGFKKGSIPLKMYLKSLAVLEKVQRYFKSL
jgi:hypothetical protein